MQLLLIRHGKSIWNLENKFTGWYDVDLAEEGILEAKKASKLIQEYNIIPKVCFTSYLKRAQKTLEIILNNLKVSDVKDLEIFKSWKLNERHYGSLQGMNKKETKLKFGNEQFLKWRRSYNTPPPALDEKSDMNPRNDLLYSDITEKLPLTECLKDTYERVIPYWNESILPSLKDNVVLIAAHGNSLRALCKYLFNLNDEEIISMEIPTGNPLLINFDKSCKIISASYLDKIRAEKLPKT